MHAIFFLPSLHPPPLFLKNKNNTSFYMPRLVCSFHSELPYPHWAQACEETQRSESQTLAGKGEPDSRPFSE